MKQEKGITLIALIISVIILLILAGVSMSAIFGENGILTKGIDASAKTKEANVVEDVEMAWSSLTALYYSEV